MTLAFRKLQSFFAAEVSPVDLRQVHDQPTLDQIRAGMDEYAVLVFHNQPLSNQEQLEFAQRFDGTLHLGSVSVNVFGRTRLAAGLSDISNVDENGQILASNSHKRVGMVTNRLWHTDASFQDPPGRYSMLSAKTIPPVSADTEFADMRAAYDALDDDMKAKLEGLRVNHSSAHNKHLMGFELTPQESAKFKAAVHPLVRSIPRSNRRSLYLAVHTTHIVDWPIPEGRLLLHELTEHATQRQFVYRHVWRPDDFVIWDNRATMHRGRPFDNMKYRRELVRVTTLDIESPAVA